MPYAARPVGRTEAVQSMLSVWMAISAVWVAFWLLIAAIVLSTEQVRNLFDWQPGACALILLVPPVGLLMVGIACRWLYVGLTAARHSNHPSTMHPAER